MAVTLSKVGKTPQQPQFGLDVFTEHYKTDTTADEVLTDASVPQKGDTHPDYPFMFLCDRNCQETGEKASALDLVYMGSLKDDGEGNPILPVAHTDDNDAVMSATSSKSSTGLPATSPISVQYYAPTMTYNWITYGSKGVKGTGPDPDRDIELITLAFGDTTFTYTSAGIAELVSFFFSRKISDTIRCIEIVAGKFWQNTESKIKNLVPFVIDLVAGFYPIFYTGGTGYVVGDSITISFSGSCVMTVTSVWSNGAIAGETITSNTLSAATNTPISATGGSGSGAKFTVTEIT